MPLLQRDDEQRPRTRRQTEMDAARHRLEEEDQDSMGATAAAEAPTGPSSEINLAAVLAAMQASMEAARREQEAARREQEANQRQLQDLIAANQEEARRDQEAKQNLILEKIDHGLVTLGEKVKNLTLEVKEVSARTDSLEMRFDDMNQKIVKLQAREPVAVGSSSHTHCTSAAKFDVPRFDGTSSWTAFKYQFETLVKTNRWDDEQSFAALTLALRGDALLVLENLPSDGRTLERLMEGLDTRYGDKHLEHVFRAQLRERTQKPNESLQQWGVEVERLVRRAYVSMTPETVEVYLVQAFIDGLRDTEVRATVRLGHHQTLKSAMAHALEVEAVRQDSRTHRVREVVVSPTVQPRQREGVVSSSAKSRYIPTCYGCGEKGHIRTDCPKRKKGSVDSGTQVNEESLN
ncbi:hypothetical protein PYW08_016128 [Mythimna loreyi]|uniref:Uncharacterized protein n=3 Tax=Mythimna loreyi TaxID=667449 RepID=A0ACC2QBT8_9NEOP|nr:hypothetical protein PYW08_010178 [Mythimna loreyi]KAJ8712872.1 hypothetical protein PYW08_008176 [Mythimna loreyi]KAJ8724654.1 hypothetical protein PYW08_016128 [Mythimna loreyi]